RDRPGLRRRRDHPARRRGAGSAAARSRRRMGGQGGSRARSRRHGRYGRTRLMPVFLDTRDAGFAAAFETLLGSKREASQDVSETVAAIIADVRKRGDAAVLALTAKFDRLELTPETMRFSAEDI